MKQNWAIDRQERSWYLSLNTENEKIYKVNLKENSESSVQLLSLLNVNKHS